MESDFWAETLKDQYVIWENFSGLNMQQKQRHWDGSVTSVSWNDKEPVWLEQKQ